MSTTTLSVLAEESPLHLSLPYETSLLAMGLAGQILGQYSLNEMTPVRSSDLNKSDLAPWDRFAAGRYNKTASSASDVLVLAVGGSMFCVDAWEKTRSQITWTPVLQDGIILGEAMTWAAALSLNVRAMRLHPRPFVYDSTNGSTRSDREAPEAAGSFFSGHASAAFVGAAYLATVYPLRHPEFQHPGLLWAGSLTAASTVAILRVAAGKHFPSDVVAGAGVGALLGWGFAKMHESHNADSKNSWFFNAWPSLEGDGFAIQAVKPLAAL